MKVSKRCTLKSLVPIAVSLLGTAGMAIATPLRLDYCVEDLGGGLYKYEFTLEVDNNDGTWVSGQGFSWIIFGDEPGTCCGGTGVSPLADFVADPSYWPAGPFDDIGFPSGGHNGPMLTPVDGGPFGVNYWFPSGVGDSITWGGTSSVDLAQSELLWSAMVYWFGSPDPEDLWVEGHRCSQDCYANCDESTEVPILNVDDFTCFINEFAAAQSLPHEQQVEHYANCDGSTTVPALNVDDFTCFINAFAAGCP